MDVFPGEIVHEFSIEKGCHEEGVHNEGGIFSQPLINLSGEINDRTVIRVVLQYEKMKISDIRIPRYMIDREKIEKFQLEN